MTADSVAPLLASLAGRVQTAIADDFQARARDAGRRAILFGIATGLAGLAVGFASYAAFLALAPVWNAALAALVVAGGNVLLAGLFVTIALRRDAKAPAPTDQPNVSAEITEELAGLVERLHDEAERNGESLVLGSLAAGVALSLLRERR